MRMRNWQPGKEKGEIMKDTFGDVVLGSPFSAVVLLFVAALVYGVVVVIRAIGRLTHLRQK